MVLCERKVAAAAAFKNFTNYKVELSNEVCSLVNTRCSNEKSYRKLFLFCSVLSVVAIANVCEVNASMYAPRVYEIFLLPSFGSSNSRCSSSSYGSSSGSSNGSQQRVRRDNKACLVKTHPPNTHTCLLFRCYSSSIRSIVVSLGCVEYVRVRSRSFAR